MITSVTKFTFISLQIILGIVKIDIINCLVFVDKNKKIILTLFRYLISVTLLVVLFKDTNFEKIFEQLKKNGAHIPDRTEDLFLTMEVLYQLSYVGSYLI